MLALLLLLPQRLDGRLWGGLAPLRRRCRRRRLGRVTALLLLLLLRGGALLCHLPALGLLLLVPSFRQRLASPLLLLVLSFRQRLASPLLLLVLSFRQRLASPLLLLDLHPRPHPLGSRRGQLVARDQLAEEALARRARAPGDVHGEEPPPRLAARARRPLAQRAQEALPLGRRPRPARLPLARRAVLRTRR